MVEPRRVTRLPFVERDLEYVGVGKLRQRMTVADLSELRKPLLIMDTKECKPLAILFAFGQYADFMDLFSELLALGGEKKEELQRLLEE